MEIRTQSTSATHPLLPELTVESQNHFLQIYLMLAREARFSQGMVGIPVVPVVPGAKGNR
jgi:hypothetical protein